MYFGLGNTLASEVEIDDMPEKEKHHEREGLGWRYKGWYLGE